MRERHVGAERNHARATLQYCRIPLGEDFFTLRRAQVDALIVCADQERYRVPKNANGSRARYFHDLMQRRAK